MKNGPQQAGTTMFFLIPKNVTSERPIALTPTFIRWSEALKSARSGEVTAEVSRGLGCYGMVETGELSAQCWKF